MIRVSRERPAPFTRRRWGRSSPRRSSQAATTRRPLSVVPGGPKRSAPRVSSRLRDITLLLNLLIPRTTRASGGERWRCQAVAPSGTEATASPPSIRPPIPVHSARTTPFANRTGGSTERGNAARVQPRGKRPATVRPGNGASSGDRAESAPDTSRRRARRAHPPAGSARRLRTRRPATGGSVHTCAPPSRASTTTSSALKLTRKASGGAVYARYGLPSKSPGGGSSPTENRVLSMTSRPATSRRPRARTAARSRQICSTTRYGSPLPINTRSPSRRPSRTGPVTYAPVSHFQAGPSTSRAASVVRSLMVDAGWRGTSARWLTSGADSGTATSCTRTLSDSAGR